MRNSNPPSHGFTLVELAIVLLIVTLLLGGLLPTVSSQIEQQHRIQTRKQLDEIQQALIGFAIVNGRLPCPADPTIAAGAANAGIEKSPCTITNGVLPWATLGVTETDAWGRRFTYSATNSFTASNFTLASTGSFTIKSSATGTSIATSIPAVTISHGVNGAGAYLPTGAQLPASTDADEVENSNGDANFVSHDITTSFDDQIVWISPNILFNRMVSAGKLP